MSKITKVHKFIVSPIMRLLVYISLALLTTLLGEIQDITSEVASTYTLWDWFKIFLVVIIPPFIVLRAFVDSSLSRNDNELFSLPEPVAKKTAPKKTK